MIAPPWISKPWPALALAALGMLLSTTACAQAPLLSEARIEPAAITPNMDGDQDVARISYRIGEPAFLSIELIGSDGEVYDFREARRRSAGRYEALFGGLIDGRMLDDDRYTVRISAWPRAARQDAPPPEAEPQVVELTLDLAGGDTEPPQIQGLSVQPNVFTPNQDGLGDRVSISYTLDEPAEMRLWLAEPDGDHVTDILETVASARFAGEPGPHQYDFDAGVDADAPPPPDGEYRIIAEARDRSGNVTREEVPLTIRDGGQPRVALSGNVDWSDTVVELGQTLWFTVTVKNIGATPLRSFGPEPGFVYRNSESFNQAAPRAWLLLARRGRPEESDYLAASLRLPAEAVGGQVGIDAPPLELAPPDPHSLQQTVLSPPAAPTGPRPARADSPAAEATTDTATASPSAPLAPDSAAVCGRVNEAGEPAPNAEVYLFFMDGDRGRKTMTDETGRYCFEDVPAGADADRSYARSPGAFRLGIEYDEKQTDLGYPFRWQLGPTARLDVCDSDDRLYLCLPPGARREVWGGIQFVEPPLRRSTVIYLALEHEDVRRIGPYNPTRLTVESP